MALAQWGAAALGAFISGIIGIGAVEYRNVREGFDERREWYTRAKRLAERIERVNKESYDADDARLGRNTCAGVHKELAQHLGAAPSEIDPEVLNEGEELIGECQTVIVHSEGDAARYIKDTQQKVATAAERANDLITMVESAKGDVGILWL